MQYCKCVGRDYYPITLKYGKYHILLFSLSQIKFASELSIGRVCEKINCIMFKEAQFLGFLKNWNETFMRSGKQRWRIISFPLGLFVIISVLAT